LTTHLAPPPADSISLFEEEEMRMVRRAALMAPGEPSEGLIPAGKMRLYSFWQMIRRRTNGQWQSQSHRQKARMKFVAKAKAKKWKAKATQPGSSNTTSSIHGLEGLD
jgi:hypothetical protein